MWLDIFFPFLTVMINAFMNIYVQVLCDCIYLILLGLYQEWNS